MKDFNIGDTISFICNYNHSGKQLGFVTDKLHSIYTSEYHYQFETYNLLYTYASVTVTNSKIVRSKIILLEKRHLSINEKYK
jgi:hypothetical protein